MGNPRKAEPIRSGLDDLDELLGGLLAGSKVVRVSEDLEFWAQVEQLHNCPFREVAQRNQDVVCALHLGTLQGALEESGGTVEATGLQPFTPSLCVASLEER